MRSVARPDHREGLGVREVGSLACACSLLCTRGLILCRALPSDDFFNTIIEMLSTIINVSAMDSFLLKKLRSNDLFKVGKLREHMDRSSLRDAMSAVAPVAAQARHPPTPPDVSDDCVDDRATAPRSLPRPPSALLISRRSGALSRPPSERSLCP